MEPVPKKLVAKLEETISVLCKNKGADDVGLPSIIQLLQDCKNHIETSEKQENRKLLEERKMLRAIIDNIPDYIFVKDLDRRHILNNKEVCDDLYGGMSEEETLGTTVYDIFGPEAAARYDEDDRRVIETGIPILNRQEQSRTPDGRKKMYLTTKVPLRNHNNEITGVVGIAKDITESFHHSRDKQLITDIILTLNNYENLSESLKEILKLVAETLNIDAAEIWLRGSYKNELRRIASWSSSEIISQNFLLERIKFPINRGFPGYVLQNEKTIIWENLTKNIKFLRSEAAKKVGLNYAIGVPVTIKSNVIGVMTFFTESEPVKKEELIELLEKISIQTGLDIQRKRSINESNSFFTHSPNLLGLAGADGYFKKVNSAFSTLLGYTDEEILSRPFLDFVHPDDIADTLKQFETNFHGTKTIAFENRYRTKSGEYKWIRWHSSDWLESDGMIFAFGHDITRLKEANLELLKFKNVLDRSKDGVAILTLQDGKRFINEALTEQLGYTAKELDKYKDLSVLFKNTEQGQEVKKSLFSGMYWRGDVKLIHKNSTVKEFYLSGGPVYNEKGEQIATFGTYTDISGRKQYEKMLEDSLREKETLLSEIHHRVKNNLAVVASMMELQIMDDDNEALADRLTDSINRIKSIASIHEQLYQSHSFSNLNLSNSIRNLVDDIIRTMSNPVEITTVYKLENVRIQVTQGVPVSLIINEVVTNVIKHAFKNKKSGKLNITLKQKDDEILLSLKDNGIGFPENFDPHTGKTLGLKLIDILTQQLEGKNEFKSTKKGITFTLRFRKR